MSITETKQNDNMAFWDLGSILTLLILLYDFVTAVFPSLFPWVDRHPDRFVDLDGALDRLREPLEEFEAHVQALRNAVAGPGQLQHETLAEILQELRTDIQEHTAASREALEELRQLRADGLGEIRQLRTEALDFIRQLRANALEELGHLRSEALGEIRQLMTDIRRYTAESREILEDLRQLRNER